MNKAHGWVFFILRLEGGGAWALLDVFGVAHGVRLVRVHPVGEWADSNIACKQTLTGWHPVGEWADSNIACKQPLTGWHPVRDA